MEQKVTEVKKNNNGFQVITESGNHFYTKTIIAATGTFSHPYLPDIKEKINIKDEYYIQVTITMWKDSKKNV
jgi:cation diffusion facilitator CzcD-associated flavoprotein CzcO